MWSRAGTPPWTNTRCSVSRTVGRARSQAQTLVERVKSQTDLLLNQLESDHLGMFDIDLGLYLSYPLSRHFQLGTKLLAGRRLTANFNQNSICRINPQIFNRQLVSEAQYNQYYKADVDYYMQQEGLTRQELLNEEFVDDDFLKIRKSNSYKVGTGLSLTYRYKEDAALRLYADYDFAAPRLTYDLKNSWADEEGNREVRSYSRRTAPFSGLRSGRGAKSTSTSAPSSCSCVGESSSDTPYSRRRLWQNSSAPYFMETVR